MERPSKRRKGEGSPPQTSGLIRLQPKHAEAFSSSSPSSPSSKGIIEVLPKMLIPQDCLPLRNTQSQSSRHFTAHIELLENADPSRKHYGGSSVLVAYLQSTDSLCAIEKVDANTYSLSPLLGWTYIDDANERPARTDLDGTGDRLNKREGNNNVYRRKESIDVAPWWDRAAASHSNKEREGSLNTTASKLSSSTITKTSGAQAIPKLGNQAPSIPAINLPEVNDGGPQTTREEVSTTLRQKYLEALYASKTSLAYFAKGPLAKARRSSGSILDSSVPVDFPSVLEELTMSLTTGDKKYASALPDFVSDVPIGVAAVDLSTDLSPEIQDKIKKSRKRKKMSKYGLLPCEEEYVCQWWLEKENSADNAGLGISHKERIKAALTKQRTRETQLQVMLVMESLAAEAAKTESDHAGKDHVNHMVDCGDDMLTVPAVPSAAASTSPASATAGKALKKARRATDLHALLDMLVDRLCIWQTTQQDEIDSADLFGSNSGSAGASSNGGSSSNSSAGGNLLLRTAKANALQDFCTEVLVPFYAARLPKILASLCQKMGTVGSTSPARPALKRFRSGSQLQIKPGVLVSRKGLKRVATEGNAATATAAAAAAAAAAAKRSPSLARSSTDPTAMRRSIAIKREPTDLLLHDEPLCKLSSALQDRRYSQREVDIAAISKATKAKLQRKAYLEQELASAIDVLKKPNSRAAVRELVDLADERNANAGIGGGTRSTSKRKREPVRSSGPGAGATLIRGSGDGATSGSNNLDGVHVKATPRANRVQMHVRNIHDFTPTARRNSEKQQRGQSHGQKEGRGERHAIDAEGERDENMEPPSSGGLCVPSSSKRPPEARLLPTVRSSIAANSAFEVAATPMKRRVGLAQNAFSVEVTPSRGVAGRRVLHGPGILAKSGDAGQHSAETACDHDNEDDDDDNKDGYYPVRVSPVSSAFVRSTGDFSAETPVKPGRRQFLDAAGSALPKLASFAPLLSTASLSSSSSSSSLALPRQRQRQWQQQRQQREEEQFATDAVALSPAANALTAQRLNAGQTGTTLQTAPVGANAPHTGSSFAATEEEEVDVYRTLGWDDENDILI